MYIDSMKSLAKKSQKKQKVYARRKHKTNVITKTTSLKPRLIVNKSNKFIYAQIVDRSGKVIASANDMKITQWTKSERSFLVGEELAKKAIKNNLTEVVFDRNGFLFHGRVKQLAEWARKGGLQF